MDRTEKLMAACGSGGGGRGAPMSARERAGTFAAEASAAFASIGELAAYTRARARDYAAEGRLGEGERDEIEREAGEFAAACRQRVDMLKDAAEAGAGARGKAGRGADARAHALGAVLALNERLMEATEAFDALRAARCAAALRRNAASGCSGTAAAYFARAEGAAGVAAALKATGGGARLDARAVALEQEREREGEHSSETQQQQQQHAEMVHAIHKDLADTLASSRQAERSALELQAMSTILSTNVAKQAEQIEALYQNALQTSANLKAGNVQLEKAKERTGQATRYSVWVMVIAGLVLLLMDWLTP